MRGTKVLEVGCATGLDLTHDAYAEAAERCGIDIDANTIEAGRTAYSALDLRIARGEAIPFPDGYFDAVLSRVALAYMDIFLPRFGDESRDEAGWISVRELARLGRDTVRAQPTPSKDHSPQT